MPVSAKIKGYTVTDCGYYDYGNPDQAQLCDLSELTRDIGEWAIAEHRPTRETKTFEGNNRRLPVYLLGIASTDRRSIVLGLWQESDTLGERFGSLIGDSEVGAAEVETADIPAGGIPGFPVYYWINPDRSLLVSIRLNTRTDAHKGVDKYLQGYLERFSSYVQKDANNVIVGYGRDEDDIETKRYPRFDSTPIRYLTNVAFIRENRESIRKLLRHQVLHINTERDRSFLRHTLRAMGLLEPQRRGEQEELKYAAEIEFSPTSAELREILANYNNVVNDTWDDIGFLLEGDPKPYWLKARMRTSEVNLEVEFDEHGMVSIPTLAEAVSRMRARIYAAINP